MPLIEIITKSAEETKKIGLTLTETLKRPIILKQALIIALEGDLGSGKTTFIQGLAKGLKIKENVLSPTFLILKQFSLSEAGLPLAEIRSYKSFYHIDAYRLKNSEELLELGFKDLINNSENIIVIEWADKIKKILPKNILWINFKNLGKSRRKIVILF